MLFARLWITPKRLIKLAENSRLRQVKLEEVAAKKEENRLKKKARKSAERSILNIKEEMIESAKKGAYKIRTMIPATNDYYDESQKSIVLAKRRLDGLDKGEELIDENFIVGEVLNEIKNYFVSHNFNVKFVLSKKQLSGPDGNSGEERIYDELDVEMCVSW